MKQLTISPEDFVKAKEVNRLLIESIFDREDSFKLKFLKDNWGWDTNDYEIYNVHVSGYRAKIILEFYDGGIRAVTLELDDIYNWYLEEANKL